MLTTPKSKKASAKSAAPAPQPPKEKKAAKPVQGSEPEKTPESPKKAAAPNPVAANAANAKTPKPRVPLANPPEIFMAPSRVRSVLKKCVNRDLNSQIEKLEQECKDSPENAELLAQFKALRNHRVRLSSGVDTFLAAVYDELLQQLMEHTLAQAKDEKHRHIVRISHLLSGDLKASVPLFRLISSLPAYVSARAQLAESELRAQTLESVQNMLRELANTYAIKASTKGDSPASVDITNKKVVRELFSRMSPAETAIDVSNYRPKFGHYISQFCKHYTALSGAKIGGISKELRVFLSQLFVELTQRLSTLLVIVADATGSRTIGVPAALAALSIMLSEDETPKVEAWFETVKVPNPELLKQEREAAKAENRKVDLSKIPTVDQITAKKELLFGSCFTELQKAALERVARYNAKMGARPKKVKS